MKQQWHAQHQSSIQYFFSFSFPRVPFHEYIVTALGLEYGQAKPRNIEPVDNFSKHMSLCVCVFEKCDRVDV